MKKSYLFASVIFFLICSCKEKYVPTLDNPVRAGYLVIEGIINSGSGPTTITLTRTVKLSATGTPIAEANAVVRVENAGNTAGFSLTETGYHTGVYSHPQLVLVSGVKYRLHIKTNDGKEFVSTYSEYRDTPDIDSISWRKERGGVQIYTTTHGSADTGFYKVSYDETWEFVSPFYTRLKLVYNQRAQPVGIVYRDSMFHNHDEELYRCWKYDTSHTILISSTEKLLKNVMYLFPTQFIEANDWRLDQRYSIQVHLYAISKQALQFYEALKKNTEQLGTIFDPQPSDNNGNMTCSTNPSEPVFGFIEISREKTKRIFILHAEVPDWKSTTQCFDSTYVIGNSQKALESLKDQIPTVVSDGTGNDIVSAFFAPPLCVDCRLRGSTKRPPYW